MKFVICHRIPERSFYLRGTQFPVCARCTGILLGYLIFPLVYLGIIRIPIILIILLNMPILIDGLSQNMGLRESNNKLRLMTGILSGFASCGLIVLIDYIIKFLLP